MNNIAKYQQDIDKLIISGDELAKLLVGSNDNLLKFRDGYEIWYSEALSLVSALMPIRINDFCSYYDNKNHDSLKKAITFTPPRNDGISFMSPLEYIPPKQIDFALSLFSNQLNILKSVKKRFESSLFDIKAVLQADLFDSELDAATELNSKGFMRGAGAIAGVVLENHLLQICSNHRIRMSKKNPTISDYNDTLKTNGVLAIPDWRFVQLMGDLRNLCDHSKSIEPTKEQIKDLIAGVNKIIKTIF